MGPSIPTPCIVVGYDGTESSIMAVTYVAERVGRTGRMFIVNAVGPVANWLGPSAERSDEDSHHRELLDQLMHDVGRVLVDRDFEVELVPGGAAEALCRVAEERNADEIVVGSRGPHRHGSPLGSVSEDVLRHARQPVVVIPNAPARGSPTTRSASTRRHSAGHR